MWIDQTPILTLVSGYGLAVAVETPVLLVLLSPRFTIRHKLLAGVWLQACTYPVVAWTFPSIPWLATSPVRYVLVAETFAPLAESVLFYLCFQRHRTRSVSSNMRDYAAIVAANALSFVAGLALFMPSH